MSTTIDLIMKELESLPEQTFYVPSRSFVNELRGIVTRSLRSTKYYKSGHYPIIGTLVLEKDLDAVSVRIIQRLVEYIIKLSKKCNGEEQNSERVAYFVKNLHDMIFNALAKELNQYDPEAFPIGELNEDGSVPVNEKLKYFMLTAHEIHVPIVRDLLESLKEK